MFEVPIELNLLLKIILYIQLNIITSENLPLIKMFIEIKTVIKKEDIP